MPMSAEEYAQALAEVSEQVPAGQWLGVIGRNGTGKSTLLRAAARLVGHEGTITIGGQPTAGQARCLPPPGRPASQEYAAIQPVARRPARRSPRVVPGPGVAAGAAPRTRRCPCSMRSAADEPAHRAVNRPGVNLGTTVIPRFYLPVSDLRFLRHLRVECPRGSPQPHQAGHKREPPAQDH